MELIEVGEDRILEVALSDNEVVRLRKDYLASSDVQGIKRFIEHQLGCEGSWRSWQSIYDGKFTSVYDVKRIG